MKTLTQFLLAIMASSACDSSSGAGDGGPDGGVGPAGDAALPPPLEQVALDQVQPGACVTPVEASDFIFRLNRYDCAVPHAAEVAGRYALEDAERPSGSRLRLETQLACRPIFEAHVGSNYFTSTYDLRTVVPSPSSWALGDRQVLCLVVAPGGGSLTTAVGGSGR